MPSVQKMSLWAIGTPVRGPPSPFARRSSARRASSRARSAVTVTKAFSAGPSRSMRPRKCRASSRLENCRAFRPAASSATVSVCNDMAQALLDDLGHEVQPGGDARGVALEFLVLVGFRDGVGPQALDLVGERVGHGLHAAGVGGRELL